MSKNVKNSWMQLGTLNAALPLWLWLTTVLIYDSNFDMAWSKIYDIFYNLVLQLYWVGTVSMSFPIPETAWVIKKVEIHVCREINRTGLLLSYTYRNTETTDFNPIELWIAVNPYRMKIIMAFNIAIWLRLVKFMIFKFLKFDAWISKIYTIIERFLKM